MKTMTKVLKRKIELFVQLVRSLGEKLKLGEDMMAICVFG